MLVRPRSPLDLSIDSSVAEVTAAMKLQKYLAVWDYPRDDDWVMHVLSSINTLEEANEFCGRLDRENRLQRGCTKVRIVREWLCKPFWQQSPDHIRTPFSYARRICCNCHETGSFQKKAH